MFPVAFPQHPRWQEPKQSCNVFLEQFDAFLFDDFLTTFLLLFEHTLLLHQLFDFVGTAPFTILQHHLDGTSMFGQFEAPLFVGHLIDSVTLGPQLQLIFFELTFFVGVPLSTAFNFRKLTLQTEPGFDTFAKLLLQVTLDTVLLPLVQFGGINVL